MKHMYLYLCICIWFHFVIPIGILFKPIGSHACQFWNRFVLLSTGWYVRSFVLIIIICSAIETLLILACLGIVFISCAQMYARTNLCTPIDERIQVNVTSDYDFNVLWYVNALDENGIDLAYFLTMTPRQAMEYQFCSATWLAWRATYDMQQSDVVSDGDQSSTCFCVLWTCKLPAHVNMNRH